ncbi:MAG: PDZ domain-containing protein [Desulfobacterales bacterium]
MHRYSFLFLLFIAVFTEFFLPRVHCGAEDHSDSIRESVGRAIDRVKPSLVKINVLAAHYGSGREIKKENAGSGTIISEDGYIITNHHVVGHAVRLLCILSNNEEIEAETIGTDPLSDIAVIRLKAEKDRKFPFVSLGDSSLVKVGDRVLAMGSPVSLSQSVTSGVASNIGVTIPRKYQKNRYRLFLDGEDVGSFVLWIGHDAAIYPGNSGGPLVNLKGEIIGINEIVFGLSGAIPSNLAKEISTQLIKNGKVTRSWIGFDVQPLLKHAAIKYGGLISGVSKGSPADLAGFKSGDILLHIGNHPVNLRYVEEMPIFHQMTSNLPINTPVNAEVRRGNENLILTVIPEEREPAQEKTIESKEWGITICDISRTAKKQLQLNNQDGVIITSVRPGGPCGEAKPTIDSRDVLIKINNKPVKNVKNFLEITESLTDGKEDPIPTLVELNRNSQMYISVINVGIKKIRDQGLEVSKAWLPVYTQVITREIARMMDMPDVTGVRVTKLLDKDYAEKTGLWVGDLIIGIDGEKIPAAFPEDAEIFPSMIRQYPIGSNVNLDLLRGNEKITLSASLPRSPRLPREMKKYRDEDYEFTVRDLSFIVKIDNQWKPDQTGVIVEEVTPGGWAALGELAVDDLVLEIDDKPVADVNQFREFMIQLKDQRPKTIVLHILRGIDHAYLELESK